MNYLTYSEKKNHLLEMIRKDRLFTAEQVFIDEFGSAAIDQPKWRSSFGWNQIVQKEAEILFERASCFKSVHVFSNKSDTISQPAPSAFYKRSNPIYHE